MIRGKSENFKLINIKFSEISETIEIICEKRVNRELLLIFLEAHDDE